MKTIKKLETTKLNSIFIEILKKNK